MWRVVATALLVGLVSAARTAAADAPPVSLDLRECPRLDEASVRRIFAADLGTRVATEPNPYITEVSISCQGARVIVRVRDPLSRKTVGRSFDSTSFGDRGEARLVAIAASELVMASWAELAANPAPAVEPEGPAPMAQTIETVRAAVRAHRTPPRNLDGSIDSPTEREAKPIAQTDAPGYRNQRQNPAKSEETVDPQKDAAHKDSNRVDPTTLRLVAVASMRKFFNGEGELWGGGMRVGEERFKVASWAVDALVESGRLSSSKVTSATLGGLLQVFARTRAITWRGGVGFRAGLLASEDGLFLGTFGWPLATTSVSFFVERVVFDVSGELGYGILPISGGAPAVREGWASAQIGVGLTL